jgi:pimeloyl-ACP methyl ester carboxylesterase
MTYRRKRAVEKRPLGRRERAARATRAAIVASLLGPLGLVSVTPAEAQAPGPNPVLVVGGNASTEPILQNVVDNWPDHDREVHTLELASWDDWPWQALSYWTLVIAGWRSLQGFPSVPEIPEGYEVPGYYPGSASNIVSAQKLANKVDEILAASSANKVDIVALSQGAAVSRWYVEQLGGASKVGALISWDGASFGIPRNDDFEIDLWEPDWGDAPPAYCQMVQNPSWFTENDCEDTPVSDFLSTLNSPSASLPEGVAYYHIYTENWIGEDLPAGVIPGNAPLEGPPFDGVTNVKIQDACPGFELAHVPAYWDPSMGQLVLMALNRDPALNAPASLSLPCNQ